MMTSLSIMVEEVGGGSIMEIMSRMLKLDHLEKVLLFSFIAN